MYKNKKEEFIVNFCNAMRDEALKKVDLMPDNWDGHELRTYLADKFAFETSSQMQSGKSSRMREYRRVIANTPL